MSTTPSPHPPAPASRPGSPMGPAARAALVVLGVLAVAALFTVSALAWAAHAVVTAPTLSVHVQEASGADVEIHVPAALVAAGLLAAPHVVPGEAWEEARLELRAELEELSPAARPAVAALVRDLATLPDATLVEVEDGTDRVRVEKRGTDLRVTVRSPEADVEVAVPLVLMERVADFVGDV